MFKSRIHFHIHLFIGTTLLAGVPLALTADERANEFPRIEITPPPGVTPGGLPGEPIPPAQMEEEPPMPEDPYWRETVERAVEQFQSENPEVRRSAVMLLGKYPVEPARRVVGKALEDPAASVRQAALVSLLEEPGQVNPAFAEPMIRLVGDPDVSIRRIASNSIRMLAHTVPFTVQAGGRMERRFSQASTRILQQAFRDEDVSVRRNMVTNFPFLQIDLPEETVVALLHDPDQEVAVHALRWGLNLLQPDTLSREASAMAEHESDIFRLELARALQTRRTPAVLQTLEKLAEDSHPPVAIEAMLAIFNQNPSASLYERMLRLYRSSGGRTNAGQRLIFAAQTLGDDGKPFLREWMKENDPALRQQAVQIFLSRWGQEVETEQLTALLQDPVQGVRQQAMRTFSQHQRQISDDLLAKMVSSRHADVRQGTAALASRLPAAQAEELLLDLLLDEVREVRVAALQQIAMRRIDGWEEIMGITLNTEDPVTQRVALDWLMRTPTPRSLEELRAYRDANPGSPLRAQIENHLQQH